MKLALHLALVGLACVACRTTSTQVPANMGSAVVVRAQPVAAWTVVDQGVTVGWLVRFDTPEAVDRSYYSVRNEHRQEIGLVDLDGRAWRYRAHVREAEWVGTGTLKHGVRAVLETSDALRLVPATLEQLGVVAGGTPPPTPNATLTPTTSAPR